METTSAVATIKSMDHHLYEDRYRILGGDVPLVRKAGRGQIFAVMDGVGGAPRGMEAAQHIADVLTGFFTDPSVPPSAAGIETLVRRASDTIHTWGLMEGGDRPMGAAACTAAWLAPDRRLWTIHVGDTAAYRLDGTTLKPLTRGHGGRALEMYGVGPALRVDVHNHRLDEGDTVCLVTDGVTRVLDPGRIGAVLVENPDLQRAADTLAQVARSARSRDDITVLLVDLEEW